MAEDTLGPAATVAGTPVGTRAATAAAEDIHAATQGEKGVTPVTEGGTQDHILGIGEDTRGLSEEMGLEVLEIGEEILESGEILEVILEGEGLIRGIEVEAEGIQ